MTSKEKLFLYASNIASINSKPKLRAIWVAKNPLRIAEEVKSERLEKFITSVLTEEKTATLNVSDVTSTRIIDIFRLKVDTIAWRQEKEPYQVAKRLLANLADVKRALYDDEATRRVAVDFVLLACRLCLIDLHRSHSADNSNPESLRIFPARDISVEITDRLSTEPVRVTGRADWAIGYGTRDTVDSDTVLVAIEVKSREAFSKAESQLVTYLTIRRQLRIQARKTNTTVQGFFTDGERYTFMSIRNDGTVARSHVFETDLYQPGRVQLKSIFNFIVTMMDTSSQSTPESSPTKPGVTQDTEILEHDNAVWGMHGIPVPDWVSDSDADLLELPDIE